MTAAVRIEERDRVAVLFLGSGENLVDTAFVTAVSDALGTIERTGRSVALVTAGEGKFFSNGFDLEHIVGLGDDAGAFLRRTRHLLARLVTFPLPTVAAVNGHAFGVGAMVALAHDRRLMREDRGWLCLPEVDLGLRLHPFMNSLVATRLGDKTTLEALTTGRRYAGQAALAGGWIDAAVPVEHLLDLAVAAASEHAGKAPATVATLKADLYAPLLALLD